jgi:uncharacterized protein (TIGR00369 family)
MSPSIPSNMDEVRRIFQAAPFIKDLGIDLVAYAAGRCETKLEIQMRHLQQDGFVHAGVQSTLADHTAGAAAASIARPGERVLTAEFKLNLLRAARGERLYCVATVLKPGSTFTVVESEVYVENAGERKLTAKGIFTLAVMAS